MGGLALRAMIFDGKQSMLWGALMGICAGIRFAAAWAIASILPCWTRSGKRGAAIQAIVRPQSVIRFVEVPAQGANKDVLGMSSILCEQIAGKKRDFFSTSDAAFCLDPEKIFYMSLLVAARDALRPIEIAYLLFKCNPEPSRCLAVLGQIEGFHLLPDNPERHWVDVIANDIAPDSICLEKRAASPHERVGNPDSLEAVGLIKGLAQWPW
jgi:hypothetical protein